MSLDAKIVLLGAQGVGKTSFVVRYVRNTFQQGNASTIGASFLAKKVEVDDITMRLQIWDTAGQERFRSMAPMYYRSATCGILCYDITSEASFRAMHSWLLELKQNLDDDIIIHIVGTKLDLVNADPSKRQVPFETCVAFAAKHLPGDGEACHEISAKDDQGVEEVFEAITRKIIERRARLEDRYLQQQNQRHTIYVHNDEPEPKTGCC
ncbi:vacuolar protein sorting-associated protein 21 [Trichomonascus vanleenenianus]|uniref:Rab family GTPase n=1 Tax=Trichomonascus vanleenenianus TaxID=2268995 RepID=UPI003ECAEDDF